MQIEQIEWEYPHALRGGPPRNKGLHVSTVLLEIGRNLGRDVFVQPPGTKPNLLWAEVGFLWEDVIGHTFCHYDTVFRPNEIQVDGIYMSPDGIEATNWILEEYKATWKSTRRLPQENWYWMMQVKAYCYGIETLEARMRILYLNGDYAQHREPIVKAFALTFTQRELDENWQAILNQAKEMR